MTCGTAVPRLAGQFQDALVDEERKELAAAADLKLGVELLDVGMDGVGADAQLPGDFLLAHAAKQQVEDVGLPAGELLAAQQGVGAGGPLLDLVEHAAVEDGGDGAKAE